MLEKLWRKVNPPTLFVRMKIGTATMQTSMEVLQKTKIMAPGPITSWQIDGETMERVTDFIFLVSKITADGESAMKLKDTFSLEEK